MRKYRILVFLFFLIVMVLSLEHLALSNGGRAKRIIYHGQLKVDGNQVIDFSTELEELVFLINSVNGKYRVLRIRIENWSRQKLDFSKEDDQVLVYVKGRQEPVKGILDIPKERDLWSKVPEGLESRLVYPKKVEAGEEENAFIFFPVDELGNLPEYIEYIVNKDKKVLLREKLVTKR